MAKVMSQSTSNPSSISQWAGVTALNGPHDFIGTRNIAFATRRGAVVSALNEAEGLSCATPDGAFYVYPDCGELLGKTSPKGQKIESDTDFAAALLKESHVAVVPGGAFHGSPNFRISYATSMTQLDEACTRIQSFCKSLT
jgi:aspartate aminotransferase